MASHHQIVVPIRRTLANVLLDLKEARGDWEQALADAEGARGTKAEEDAGDRMSEADQRLDELRDEFAAMFVKATGVTWKQVQDAEEGLLL